MQSIFAGNFDAESTKFCYPSQNLTLNVYDDITIGDVIQLKNNCAQGIVRFIGEVNCLKHKFDRYFGYVYFGIELFEANGDNNGTINGEYYFKTEDKKGIFVKRNEIRTIITINYYSPRVTIDGVIYLNEYKCNGRIRYMGRPEFNDDDEDDIYYGIQLNDAKGTNNGMVNNKCYFSFCKPNYGIFLKRINLLHLLKLSNNHALIRGFMKKEINEMPSDILNLMACFFSFIRIEFHQSVSKKIMVNKAEKNVEFSVFQVFDFDGNIFGPELYVPESYSLEATDKCAMKDAVFIDEYSIGSDESIDELAALCGVSIHELKGKLKEKEIKTHQLFFLHKQT